MFAWLRRLLKRVRTGYLPDPPDSRDRPIGRLRLATEIPAAHSLDDPRLSPVKDQGGTSSCVGQAVANGVRLAFRALGRTVPDLSALFAYFNARREAGQRVTDSGTYIRSAIKALTKLGICAEAAWPQRSPVNRQPRWGAYRGAHDFRGVRGYYRIPERDVQSVREAIASGRPVVGGWQVDRPFTSNSGPEVQGPCTGPSIGGHAMLIVAYLENGNFVILNSWGPDWRTNGRQVVSEAFVREARDKWAIDMAA